jgi:hypothetical protein
MGFLGEYFFHPLLVNTQCLPVLSTAKSVVPVDQLLTIVGSIIGTSPTVLTIFPTPNPAGNPAGMREGSVRASPTSPPRFAIASVFFSPIRLTAPSIPAVAAYGNAVLKGFSTIPVATFVTAAFKAVVGRAATGSTLLVGSVIPTLANPALAAAREGTLAVTLAKVRFPNGVSLVTALAANGATRGTFVDIFGATFSANLAAVLATNPQTITHVPHIFA